ncbi:MAG: hypothetical protein IPL61_10185 [Myxococcales bacterium]|nr:hypothetical protein [Myxococcales bacterium]
MALAEDIDGGYTATITTSDASAVATIRAHAAYVVGASKAGAGTDALRFGGATGDRTRNCPVILDGTTITRGGGRSARHDVPGRAVALALRARPGSRRLTIMRDGPVPGRPAPVPRRVRRRFELVDDRRRQPQASTRTTGR